MSEEAVKVLPVLPLKNTVLFPYLLMPLSVGRSSSLAAVQAALATEEKEIVLVAQRDAANENPGQDDLYTVGTKAVIRKMSRPNENLMEVLVMGAERVVLVRVDHEEGYLKARISPSPLPEDRGAEVEALAQAIVELAAKAVELAQPQAPPELARMLAGGDDPLRMCFLLASMLSLETTKEQALLEAASRADGLRLMHAYLSHEVQVLELKSKIANTARNEMSKEQRDYLLRQQMRAIQQELGEKNPEAGRCRSASRASRKSGCARRGSQGARPGTRPSRKAAERLARTQRDPQLRRARARTAVEYVHARTIWTSRMPGRVLDEDHFGLKEVKERILEHLGVLKMNPNAKSPILCLVGPPGVGKTSLGQSIARALGRNFERISLAACTMKRNSAAIAGHTSARCRVAHSGGSARRRSKNPVLMLDEIDKLGRDYRGIRRRLCSRFSIRSRTKRSATTTSICHVDLSKIFSSRRRTRWTPFPRPLLDRMEILRLSGYTEEEKVAIAKKYLLPRQLKESGFGGTGRYPRRNAETLIRDNARGRLASSGASDRPPDTQDRVCVSRKANGFGDSPARGFEQCSVRSRSRRTRCGRASVPAWSRTRLDGDRWRRSVHRSYVIAGRKGFNTDRPAWRRDEGIRKSGAKLGLVSCRGAGDRPRPFQKFRCSHPRSGRSNSEGWTFRRHHNGDGPCFGLLKERCSQRHCHDG